MKHTKLSNWNKARLRGSLLVFFFALAVPTGFLLHQAYSQLKWEAFHRHRLLAEELVNRITERYSALVKVENERTFTDYTFLNISGFPKENYLLRSQLSSFPVEGIIPGTIGYFQVDHNGRFSTPLLPTNRKFLSDYGIQQHEQQARATLQEELYELLSVNNMLAGEKVRREAAEARRLAELKRRQETERMATYIGRIKQQEEQKKARAKAEASGVLKTEEPVPGIPEVLSQSSFDSLQSRSADIESSRNRGMGKVDDLNLKNPYQKQIESEQKKFATTKKYMKESPSKSKSAKRALRKEKNILPGETTIVGRSRANNKPYRISMFESEIDTLEFGVLDSGHFILYRKVWRDGQRYIQGFLVRHEDFLNAVIRDSFYKSPVSAASNMVIAYQGDILSAFNSSRQQGLLASAAELQGTLLLQSRLAAPFDQLELILTVDNLPAGPGGTVLTWTAIVLLLVLCSGFLLMYRLGMRQLNLARQQQDFVSAVSHELKTPLTSIRMYGEMLREGWADESKRKTYYDYIYDESERLTRLINNILQLARMTRNDLQAELSPVSVAQLMDNLRSKIQSQVDHAGFTLNLVCEDVAAAQVIYVDPDYFSQIIINIVDNAIKFSARSAQKQIDITCTQLTDGQIQIGLRDYGPGIPRDQMRKIFQLFYRTENELTRETVGTGIGLALVQQLVQLMHGRVDVVNMEPGVEFRIVFPPADHPL
ncbi:MAG: ATP-binding protein [Gammaproteobacteria bacterium]|nr:ATP-binding protein [Gammaproteobacteria bacterium]MDH5650718.1 ATP-binding protein [Gammaproteobacteria bacterium]